MENTIRNKPLKELTLGKALFGFLAPLATILILLKFDVDVRLGLMVAIAVEALFALYLGHSWVEIEEMGVVRAITRVATLLVIMVLIGMLVSVWLCSGSVQTMLYFGVNLINAKFFLPIAFIICIITSVFTGTSWGTAGTMGIALIGVSETLGVPTGIAAAAIISGALIGDKVSPLSDSTLLASASAGVDLIDHIISLCHVTIPVALVAGILFTLQGFRFAADSTDFSTVKIISDSLLKSCNVSIWMLLPVFFVLLFSALRKPPIAVFVVGVAFGFVWAVFFQGMAAIDIINSLLDGYVSNTGNADIDGLLSRGGVMYMMYSIFVAVEASMLSGMYECTGVLSKLMDKIQSIVKNKGSLVLSVAITGLALMYGGAGQACTLTLPAVTFRNMFKEMDIHPSVLSRTLESTGTVLGSIVPWDASAVIYTSLFGVSVSQYLPYAYVSILTPIFAVVTAYIGLGMFRWGDSVSFVRERGN